VKKTIEKPDLIEFKELLGGDRFYQVPEYQRSYSWYYPKAVEFFEEMCLGKNKSDYNFSFCGSIIAKHGEKDEKGYYELIDGQQRFITIFIILAVLRDYAKNQQNYLKKSEAYNHLVKVEDDCKKKLTIAKRRKIEKQRLTVGDLIAESFNKFIIDERDYEEMNSTKTKLNKLRNSHEQNILRNYKKISERLDNRINEIKKENKDIHEELYDILDNLEEIQVIQINVTDDVAAYEIFETVNSKNEPLTGSDLIKNYILKSLDKDRRSAYEEKWDATIKNIDKVDGFTFNRFLRFFWISKYSWSTERKLYANFKIFIENDVVLNGKKRELQPRTKSEQRKLLTNFLDDLEKSSELFIILKNPTYDKYIQKHFSTTKNHHKKIINSLETIDTLKVSQCYVLMLSIFRNLVKAKDQLTDQKHNYAMSRCLMIMIRKIETFSILFHTLGKGQANKVEKNVYSDFSIEIEKMFSKDYGDEKLKNKWTNTVKCSLETKLDKILKNENISKMDGLESALDKLDYDKELDRFIYRYIFEKINQYKEDATNFSFNPDSTIEHILPRNPEKWGLNSDQTKDYVNKIGNCIIISSKLNERLGNHTLEKKLYGVERGGKIQSYHNDTCKYNKKLYEKMEDDLKKSKEIGTKYWNENAIHERTQKVAEDFKFSIDKYLNPI